MKPKCPTCERSMKRPYHRKGTSGKWEGITTWWYCQSCNYMEETIENNLPRNIQEYLDTAMKSMEKPKVQYYSVGLSSIQQDMYKFHNSSDQAKELFRYSRVPNIALRSLSKSYNMYNSQKILSPYWICQICSEMVETDPLLSSMGKGADELADHQPVHCKKIMKLAIQDSMQYNYQLKQMKYLTGMENGIVNQNEDEVSIKLLLMLLNVFYYEGLQALKKVVSNLFNTNSSLTDFWGYTSFQMIISAMTQRHKNERLHHNSIVELLNKPFYITDEPIRLQRLSAIFDDLVLISRNVSIKYSLEMRNITNHLISKIADGVYHGLIKEPIPKFIKLRMQEFPHLRELQEMNKQIK